MGCFGERMDLLGAFLKRVRSQALRPGSDSHYIATA